MKFNTAIALLLSATGLVVIPSSARLSSPSTLQQHENRDMQLVAGGSHSCIIRNNSNDNNNLMCWGRNEYGQLGDGTNEDKHTPTSISISIGDDETYPTKISLGGRHSCVIDNFNNLLCWGSNYCGELGDGTNEGKNTPTTISLGYGATHATQIALGFAHSCAIDNINNIQCWGSNIDGQLGNGRNGIWWDYSSQDKNAPVLISLNRPWANKTYATQIALGGRHTCVIDNLNRLLCWGDNEYGQLGNGKSPWLSNRPTVISISNGATYVTQISLGSYHSCAIDNINNLQCWGMNWYGQLGDGGKGVNTNNDTPTIISLHDNANETYPTQLSLGRFHSCAIGNHNNLFCWGANWEGEIGDGTSERIRTTPVVISLNDGATYATQIGLGHSHSCAIFDDHNHYPVMCWGENVYGQIGDGTNTTKNTPTHTNTNKYHYYLDWDTGTIL